MPPSYGTINQYPQTGECWRWRPKECTRSQIIAINHKSVIFWVGEDQGRNDLSIQPSSFMMKDELIGHAIEIKSSWTPFTVRCHELVYTIMLIA